jgi:two-component system, NarL family, invasion response regulator UvrY
MLLGDHQLASRRAEDTGAVRIVVADKRAEVRSALRLLLEQDGGMTVVSEAATAVNLVEQLRRFSPDVVLVDCDLPGLPVTGFLLQLRSACPGVRVVALCSRPEMRLVALTAGADAFLCKTEPPETLVDAIREWFRPDERAHGQNDEQRR